MPLKVSADRSQLIPPRLQNGVLRCPQLETRLAEVLDYPLTVVEARTGYGQGMALATLADAVEPLFRYSIAEPDHDPLLFLAHQV